MRWELVGVMALLVACSADSDRVGDGRGDSEPSDARLDRRDAGDGGGDADGAPRCPALAAPLDCAGGGCQHFVVDALRFPPAGSAPGTYGVDHDGDGVPDNALADIMTTLSKLAAGTSPQPAIDEAIARGKLILLLRSKRTADGCLHVELARGEPASCCTSSDLAACIAESRASCFAGAYTFTVDASLSSARFAGALDGDRFALRSPDELELPIYGSLSAVLRLPLGRLHLRGKLGSDAIDEAALAGAASERAMLDVFLPSFAAQLDAALKAPDTGAATRDFIKKTFDSNSDGTISADEVTSNPLTLALFKLDLDLDHDGKGDHMSFAFGFHAVSASF